MRFLTTLAAIILCLQPIWAGDFLIRINIPERRLFLQDQLSGKVIKEYPVGVGRSVEWATPIGQHTVLNKTLNPGWIHPHTGKKIDPNQANPLGTRWIGFARIDKNEYGIHGSPKA